MTTFVDLATVREYGGLAEEGEPLKPARVTTLGSTSGMVQAKLYIFGTDEGDEEDVVPRWREHDTLIGATITTNDRDGSVTVEGKSTRLVNELMLKPSDADVRWEIKPAGCVSCR